MNKNLLKLLGAQLQNLHSPLAEGEDIEPEDQHRIISVRTAAYQIRNRLPLSNKGISGVLEAFAAYGNTVLESDAAEPQERALVKAAVFEAVELGLERERIEVALEFGT